MSESMPDYKLVSINILNCSVQDVFFSDIVFITSFHRFHLKKETFIRSESSNVK